MNFCEADIDDYNFRNCGIDYAGIAGIGLINIYENPTITQLQDPNFWISKTTESPLRYFVVRNTRGEYLGGSPVEEDDLVGKRVVGVDHSMTIESTGMLENWEFWAGIQKHLWKMVFVSSGGLMYYVDKPTSVHSRINNQKSTKTGAFWQCDLKWHDLSNPVILEAPDNIFFGLEPVFLGTGGFDYTLNFSFV